MAGLGGISGIVSDASGARIPGAQVTVTNADKGINRVLNSNEAGLFNVGSLTPDSGYAVKVSKDGFEISELKNITVQVGQVVSLNIALAVSGTAAVVNVVDEAPVVDSQKQGVSQVVNAERQPAPPSTNMHYSGIDPLTSYIASIRSEIPNVGHAARHSARCGI